MKKTIEVANVLLQNDLAEILLLQRGPRLRRSYLWGLPGGLIDEGEGRLQAATRELQEETGLIESMLSIGGLARFLVEMPQENIKITNVQAELIVSDPLITLDPREHVAFKWSSATEVYTAGNLLPGVPTMISSIISGDKAHIVDPAVGAEVKVHRLD